MDANELTKALADKHADDVFVAECKNGPTWDSQGSLRLDAWVMRKSWSPWSTIGYEIKVSRSDFENDQKWPRYLDVCHEFYFVCPAKLINAVDLPKGVGLIWASSTGRLHAKVKATRRAPDAEKLGQLMSYVLMSRARIVANMHEAGRDQKTKEQLYREEVEKAERRKELAYFVSEHVRVRFAEQRDRLLKVDERCEWAAEVEKALDALGIPWREPPGAWRDRISRWEVDRELNKLAQRLPGDLFDSVRRAKEAMTGLERLLNGIVAERQPAQGTDAA